MGRTAMSRASSSLTSSVASESEARRAFRDLDYVELRCDLPEHGLTRGERGTVVHVFDDADVYLVELVDPEDGSTRALVELTSEQLRPVIAAVA
jgi:hypothetical protein